MRRARLAAVLVMLALAAAATLHAQRIRSGIELVSLSVTVTEGGKYITDLDESEFEVFEDGTKQAISFFSRAQQPIALAILLDTSNSMEEQLATAQEAAIGFVRRMRPEDATEVVAFNSKVDVVQPMTSDVSLLEKAIRSTSVNGSTSLYNALYVALKGLKRTRAQSSEEIRRHALVVLSDGDDTSSMMPYEEVLDLAKRSETAIYAIGLRQADIGRPRFKEAEFVLRQLSQETGGRAFFINTVVDLPKIYQQISEELSNQYALAYTPKNTQRNGAWRRIVVRVTRPGATARTRLGYFAPAAPKP